jgi:hypothetical protein
MTHAREYLIDALYSPNTGLTSRDTEEIVESMENIDHEGSLVFLLRMRDKWDDRHTKKSTRLKYYKSVSRFFFRQFLMNMQRYDEDVDLAPSKDILMTDMVYLQLNGDLQDFATRKGSPDVNGPNLNGGKVWIAQLLQLRVMFRLLGGEVENLEIGYEADINCAQIRFTNMTEAIYIVEGGVNPDHYEKYLVDCAVLGGTIAYDLYKFNENSPTSGHAIAYAMVNERMRLFDSNIAEPYHIFDINNKWRTSGLNVPRVHELKRYANKHVDTVGWEVRTTLQTSKAYTAMLMGPPLAQVGGAQEYAQNRTVPHRHASHIQPGHRQAPASIAIDDDSWDEEDELAHLTMMYMFVTLAKHAGTNFEEGDAGNFEEGDASFNGGGSSLSVYSTLLGLTLAMGLLPR